MTKDVQLGIELNVLNPEKLAEFYVEHLGMKVQDDTDGIRLSFGGIGASIVLRRSPSPEPYQPQKTDQYWKFGLVLPNIDIAYAQLKDKGVNVSEPRQFEEIGYLCHITDPEGFCIELLQHTFAGQTRTSEGDPNKRLGGGAEVGHITLRTSDINSDIALYRDQHGMKLLSVQPAEKYGFTLYFFAFTEETPPQKQLEAVENRPWLWQRPYTTLEIQHVLTPEPHIKNATIDQTGSARLLLRS